MARAVATRPPGTGTPSNRRTSMRQAQLVDAMADSIRHGMMPATMADLARAAGMSTATAYRYYQSLDDVAQAYLVRVMAGLRDFSRARPETGRALIHVVTRFWVDLVVQHGAVTVQIRSRRGFFDRLYNRVPSTVLGYEARLRPIYGLLAELGLPASLQEDAAMLYNTMFDPREILDLIRRRGFDADQVTLALLRCYEGALRGWYEGVKDAHPAI